MFEPESKEMPGAAEKILVIDDETEILRYFKRLLTGQGYAVETAGNSQAGCELAEDPSVAVIISDLHMPGALSKLDLIRKLRELRPDCPLVVVSGYPAAESLQICRELGVAEFLTRPFEIAFITSVLKQLRLRNSNPPDAKTQ